MIIINENKVGVESNGLTAKMPLKTFLEKITPVPHGSGLILPDGIKAIIPGALSFVAIHQTPPRVWSFKWVKPDGPLGPARGRQLGEESYRTVTIALPYVITLGAFSSDGVLLSGYSQCFFTTRPVTDLKDELFLPHLPNVLTGHYNGGLSTAGICTSSISSKQLGGKTQSLRFRNGLSALLHCLFGTGFNNDGSGGWYYANRDIDKRLNPVEDWEIATAKDPLFVIKNVKWKPSGFTCQSAANWINKTFQPGNPIDQFSLERIVFNEAGDGPKPDPDKPNPDWLATPNQAAVDELIASILPPPLTTPPF